MLRFRIQGTPNPRARKYVVNYDLKTEGKVTYKSRSECAHLPLGQALFTIPGVQQIHFFENVATVTQDGNREWADFDQQVQEAIIAHIDKHDPKFPDSIEKEKEKEKEKPKNWSPVMQKIDEILDEMIRPSLQMDGGDIEVVDLEENILTLRYMGACGGCPTSMSGTLEAIRGILKDEIHQDLEIVAIDF
ncbi:MAG: NifU family protein [Deltaproteobacteria bacterium]|nr:NifU family protein [Deltaproteobacteria bacterium]